MSTLQKPAPADEPVDLDNPPEVAPAPKPLGSAAKSELMARAIAASKGSAPGTAGAAEAEARVETGVRSDHLVKTINLDNIKMRKLTFSGVAMLEEIRSPLIHGTPLKNIKNIFIECLKVIVVQSLPLEEATELVFRDPFQVTVAAIKLGEQITADKTQQFVDTVLAALREATETKVTPVPDKKGKGPKKPGDDGPKVRSRHG